MKNIKVIFVNFLVFITLFFSFSLVFTLDWLYRTFGNLTMEEIMFQIRVPMTGSNTDFYYNYAQNVLPYIIIFTIISYLFICFIFGNKKLKNIKAKKKINLNENEGKTASLIAYKKTGVYKKFIGKILSSILMLLISITYAINKTNLLKYIEDQLSNSTIIEKEYVDVTKTKLEFPENKRNLIYIYLESMEATFFSKENGGAYDESIIPELEELAIDNISFSGSDELSGLYSLPGTTWTVGAMVAQTSGLPLKIPIDGNSYDQYDSFLPGVTSIGQVLEKEDYNQMLVIGSKAEFGGRKNYFEQHGNYTIFDFHKAVAENKKTEEDFEWWGFSDNDLFEYAKEKLTQIAEEDKPFNFTMLTVDTHHVDGYLCKDCEDKYQEQYYNVLACSSKKVKQFVNWVKTQDFYKNTTIVICGDHPSMQPYTFDKIENNGYKRTVYNTIINSVINTESTNNKYCSTLDMFPTTLASLGVKIDGDKLGIGTNLFSNKETIIKKYGLDYLCNELAKNSNFYSKKFVYEKRRSR